jgi:hypothetical protein
MKSRIAAAKTRGLFILLFIPFVERVRDEGC